MPVFIDLGSQAAGTYTFEDDGTPGNNTSRLRGPSGNIVITFVHPADEVVLLSRSDQQIVVNFTDILGTANLTIGNIFASAQRPGLIQVGSVLTSGIVSLASSGAISELGSDAEPEIAANRLLMVAGTGIGAGNPLEMLVSFLEAESNSGGINLTNVNNLTIGGIANGVRGLFTGSSGNITLTNLGSITFADDDDGVENVHSAGNVLLSAVGSTADINASVSRPSIFAAGNITLNAGRDVLLGTAGASFNNDVRAGGSIFVSAGRDFFIDGDADFTADDFGPASGGGITIAAGRDIRVDDISGSGASLRIAAAGSAGSVTLTAGVDGLLLVGAPSGISGGSGGVAVRADRILLEPDSGISAPVDGIVSITTVSNGRRINVGARSPGPESLLALEMGPADLDRIFARNLVIGGTLTGDVNIVGAGIGIAMLANLTVQSGADLFSDAPITTTSSVTLSAAENLTVGGFWQIDTVNFAVRVDTPDNDPQGGLAIQNGPSSATTQTITGNADNDTLNGSNLDNMIFGLGGSDILRGFGGGDSLDGGAGADAMFGGLGNDFYVVDNAADQVTETAGQGNDIVFATASYALAAGQEIESLGVLIPSGTAPIDLTGNEFANRIVGNAGSNGLSGGGGADDLFGDGGNDFYVVDNVGDRVFETAGNGFDIVFATVSYALLAGQEVESLGTLNPAGTSALMLIGNELANRIVGNAGANFINGGAGPDELYGDGGVDEFGFTTALGGGNVDFLGDFNSAADTIDLASSVFVGLGFGPLNPSFFGLGTSADADDRIIYDSATGRIFFDSDAAGAGAQILFATVAPGTVLNASDFVII